MNLPEIAANKVLDQLQINSPEDLLLLKQIVRKRGAVYNEKPLEGAEARLILGLKKPIISVSTRIITPQRKRFSIAHELGHLELHAKRSRSFFCSSVDIQYKPDLATKQFEQEANQFAASFLIPARFVEIPFKEKVPSFDLIKDWSKKLETSLTATAFRFVRYTQEPIAIVFSKKGYIQYFQASSQFEDLAVFPDVKNAMGNNTTASQIFQGISVKDTWRTVKAKDWFRKNNDSFDPSDVIQEWSIGMPTYDAVLTLLWVNKPLGMNSW